jgi:hypothetical protein
MELFIATAFKPEQKQTVFGMWGSGEVRVKVSTRLVRIIPEP